MQGTAIRTSGIKSLKIAYKLKKVWEKKQKPSSSSENKARKS